MIDPRDNFRAAIISELGAAPDVIEPGRFHRFPTRERRGDDAGFCKLFDDQRGGVYGCNRQFPGQVFTWSSVDRERMTPTERAALVQQIDQARRDRDTAQRAQWAANAGHLAKLWSQCTRISSGDPVARYLARRMACEIQPVPECLRLHTALPYRVEGKVAGVWPAMVARLSAPDGRLLALHRTWLTPEGQKAPTPGPCKKLTPTAGHLIGASIRLGTPEHGQLGVAEGIETALAARLASGVPTVAAYSGGALANWMWPTGLRRVVIFADADPPGAEAAAKLRQRAAAAGLSVDVLSPSTPGTDWCDVWANRESKEATT